MKVPEIIEAAAEAKNWLDMQPDMSKDKEAWKQWLGSRVFLAGEKALKAAAELLKQVEVVEQFPKGKWLPIEKGYYDAEVYLCYFPENKGVEKYKSHVFLSIAKTKGATHYMIPQPPVIIAKEGV